MVAFFSAKDIPGKNTFIPTKMFMVLEGEEVFCSSDVKFNGQPVGVIVAETNELANYAATIVEITYQGKNSSALPAVLS